MALPLLSKNSLSPNHTHRRCQCSCGQCHPRLQPLWLRSLRRKLTPEQPPLCRRRDVQVGLRTMFPESLCQLGRLAASSTARVAELACTNTTGGCDPHALDLWWCQRGRGRGRGEPHIEQWQFKDSMKTLTQLHKSCKLETNQLVNTLDLNKPQIPTKHQAPSN